MSQFPDMNPYESPNAGNITRTDPSFREQARAKVGLPALFLLILSPFAILLCGVDLAFWAINDPADNPMLGNMNDPGVKQGAQVGIVIGGAFDVIAMIGQVVVIFGAIQMRSLSSRSMAMAAAIISCIPCLSGCCVVGIPFGIWSLVVMNDPMVKQAFDS